MGIQGGYSYWGWESGGGAVAGLTLIESKVLSVAASSATFSSIPQTYSHLSLRLKLRSTKVDSDPAQSWDDLSVHVNGDTGSNYSIVRMYYNTYGNSHAGNAYGGITRIAPGLMPTATAASDNFGSADIDFTDYRGASHKIVLSRGGFSAEHATRGIEGQTTTNAQSWDDTAAITSLAVSFATGNLEAGCRLDLYGVI